MSFDTSCIVMFPYPSGSGLHVGHAYNYTIVDSWCRWHRHRGERVFQPFGYDAFGLPAENHARAIGGDPALITAENIGRYRGQLQRLNTAFDERLITYDPSYTRWTQWLFLRLRERGLAYRAKAPVNWCSSCETVLANEQAQTGACDRCGTRVTLRDLDQWFFRITDYRDRLIAGLPRSGLPASTQKRQRDWLANQRDWCVSRQRKWGCPIPVEGETDTLDTFVDSSFYWLRYLTESETEFLPRGAWRPVDLYVGGPEHACMHLIYARFVHMVLFDMGIVPEEEPFRRVVHQGMITYRGAKMSKSRGNTVSPDGYDPDELRLHLMFLGPWTEGGEWSDANMPGVRRFLARMRRWLADIGPDRIGTEGLEERIDADVRDFRFNTVVSGLMSFYNAHKAKRPDAESAARIGRLLRVFAPGFSAEASRPA